MKIRGRFIGILAVLGLLIALVPLAQAGAVAGTVSLSGGEKGQYFSAQTDKNIVIIQINDPDLTPLRSGTARSMNPASGQALDLASYVVVGEKEITQMFDGGVHSDTPADDMGDAVLDGSGATDTYMFQLKDEAVARDRQNNNQIGAGIIGTSDIISVVVNGRTAVASTDNDSAPSSAGTGPWFTVAVAGAGGESAVNGGGIVAVVLHNVVPQDAATSVSITFTDTEFKFSPVTPLDIDETRVNHGGTNYTNATSRAGVTGASGAIVSVGVPVGGYTIVSFAYDVSDTYAANRSMVTLNSTSAGDIRLAIKETMADSDTFQAMVAVFSQEDRSAIATAAGDMVNDDNEVNMNADGVELDNGIVNIDELIGALDTTGGSRSLMDRVSAAALDLGYDRAAQGITSAETLLDKIVQARHNDVITVTYQDADPAASVSRSARVDMEAPVVTLVSPVDGFFTNIAAVTMSAEVTDDGAGVDPADIELKINLGTTGLSRGAAVESPIVNGYRVTATSQGTISEGQKKWFVGVMDKVGNIPTMNDPATDDVNEGAKGAASNLADLADNPFKFTVDTRAPTLTGGKTGRSLKNPGVTTGASPETENKNQDTWVRVVFNVGEGGAPLDPTTVSVSDFRVNDVEPLDAKINSVNLMDDTTSIAKGTAVYLQVGQLDSDARPRVELTGEIRDRAGNIRTEGRLANVSDGLAPKLTVTPSADIAKDEVTITVTSSENLRTNPMLELTQTKPEKNKDLISPTTPSVSLQTGSLTTYTATFKNASGQASKQYVTAKASDAAGNEAMKGFAANENDFVSFQVDAAAPDLDFVDAAGKDLKSTKQEEGAVWIVAEFDEDEHAGDSYRKVEVTALKLMNKGSEEVITEDASMVFASEVDCDDHAAAADADPVPQDKCAQRTLAIDLAPGMYNIAVTGVDQTGNEVKGNTDFEVTEAKPFELTLRPGQNFIAIPGMPMDDGGNLDTLFSDEAISAVSTYDRSRELAGMNPWLRSSKDLETGMFSGDITAIEPGKAYFVNSTASVTVKVKLQAAGQLPPTIPVRQGFNAIGFWSVAGDEGAEIDLYLGSIGWSVAYTYDPTPGRGWEVIRKDETDAAGDPLSIVAGKGYLVYALYDAVLTP